MNNKINKTENGFEVGGLSEEYTYELELLLDKHDWWYSRSDDQRAWQRGRDSLSSIQEYRTLIKNYKEIYNAYAPEELKLK
jgi:hypothetical protein